MATTRSVALAIALGVCVALPLDAADDLPCATLVPDHGALGFRQRTGDVRCEGFYKSNVSGEALSIAFLVAGQVPSAPLIEITGAGPAREVHVRAVALPLGIYYRMDATVTPRRPLRWPLAEVVQASQSLKASDLGLYGWFGDPARPTYTPVRAKAPGAQPVAEQAPVRLGIRANVALDLVHYNVADDASCRFGNQPWKRLAADVRPGGILTIVLRGEGPATCVSFRGKPADSDASEALTARISLR
jgi:hypothetical protein